jgi:hypothetical protein
MARNTNRSPKAPAAEAQTPQALDPALESKGLTVPSPVALAGYTAPAEYTGFEEPTAEDIKVPFLAALQDLSPQVKAGPKQVPGARAGLLFDSLTGEMFEGTTGVAVIPVMRIRQEQEWNPRTKGGGLVAIHDPKAPKIAKQRRATPFGKIKTAEGTEIVQTVKLYLRYQHPTTREWRPAIVAFTSSNMGEYQRWFTIASNLRFPVLDADGQQVIGEDGVEQTAVFPMFAHRWRLRTVFHTRGEQTWFKLKLDLDGESYEAVRLAQSDPQYKEAHALANMVRDGRVVEDDAGSSDTHPDDEVPEL